LTIAHRALRICDPAEHLSVSDDKSYRVFLKSQALFLLVSQTVFITFQVTSTFYRL
jgi:hypothetical protein